MKCILLSLFLNLCVSSISFAQVFEMVDYTPLSKKECVSHQQKLGLEYCPTDNDHLAGAALACGHIDNLPSEEELLVLARKVYHIQGVDKYIDGPRDNSILQELNIFAPEKNIFYWSNAETSNRRGAIRMFAPHSSYPFYVTRDGSAYIPMRGTQKALKYDIIAQRGFKSERKRRFDNKIDAPGFINNDVLKAICVRETYATDISDHSETDGTELNNIANQPNLRGLSRERSCAVLCGKDFYYYRAKNIQGLRTYICHKNTEQKDAHSCKLRESMYNNVKYICECI